MLIIGQHSLEYSRCMPQRCRQFYTAICGFKIRTLFVITSWITFLNSAVNNFATNRLLSPQSD